MTKLPPEPQQKLGLLIDLDVCVGCQACATSCKEWNDQGISGPLHDSDPYGANPDGVWFNRIHSYQLDLPDGQTKLVHFPKSCLHCDDAPCVTVCPTGASYKREADGIVLVNPDSCIGCKLCSWACPYGAREFDSTDKVMKKCTLCIDRIYNEDLDIAERQPACVLACPTSARTFGDFNDPNSLVSQKQQGRQSVALMAEQQTKPVNRYLLPKINPISQQTLPKIFNNLHDLWQKLT